MTASSFGDVPTALAAPAPVASPGAGEFVRYFGASALALAVDAGLFALLLGLLGVAWAAAVGFVTGLFVAYALSVRFVFRVRACADRRAEFTIFAAIGIVGLVLTEVLLWWMVGLLHWSPLPSKLVTAGAVFACNFTLRKVLLFTARHGERSLG